jgi:phosphoglycerate dehydrogenase-like enzyme
LRAKAFNLKVLYYDPYIEYGRAKALGVFQVDSLEDLLSQSDIVSVHCPLIHNNKSNVHLLNKETMKHLKDGSYIINTARGPIIQEEALLEALRGKFST